MHDFQLPADTHAGHVRLQVQDLAKELGFYRDLLGLHEVKREGRDVFLAAGLPGPYLFILSEKPDAATRPRRSTGLYHVAVRYPDRRALARTIQHLAQNDYPIGGASDHQVSEAFYLDDPEGNGIELYTDRPRATWPRQDGQIAMTTAALNVGSLMRELQDDREPWSGADPRTEIGHVHLQVSDLARAEAFYHGLLGLDVTQRSYPGALFFSAGGYHHHLGANIWNSRGAAPPPAGAPGLLAWSLYVPDGAAWVNLIGRLRAAGVAAEAMEYPAADGLASFMVHDADGIGLELIAPRAAVNEETMAAMAQG